MSNERPGAPRITVSPARAQALRERAQACLGVALILGLMGIGVGASGGNAILAITLGFGGIVFLCLFGMIWDMQTAREDEPKVDGLTLALGLGPTAAVVVIALLSLAQLIPGLPAVGCMMALMCLSGLFFNMRKRKLRGSEKLCLTASRRGRGTQPAAAPRTDHQALERP